MRLLLAACLVLGLGIGTSHVEATPLSYCNPGALPVPCLASLEDLPTGLGSPLASLGNPLIGTIGSHTGQEVGWLQGDVYSFSGSYLYVLTVEPFISDVSMFQTGTGLLGFPSGGPTKVGYNFTQAGAAFGGSLDPSLMFFAVFNDDAQIQWILSDAAMAEGLSWNPGTEEARNSIQFFFQSDFFEPSATGEYSMINGGVAVAVSNAPLPTAAPEPGTLLLLGSGLVGTMGLVRSRRRV
jgi:hypothetical protein